MSPHCLPQFRDPQIAELKKILTDKGLIALKDEASSKKEKTGSGCKDLTK
jgi:hypothetical protein